MSVNPNQIAPRPYIQDALVTPPATGTGKGAFFVKDLGGGNSEGAYKDHAGNEVILTNNGGLQAEANTGANVGAGAGLFRDKTGATINFKTLVAGANISITPQGADELLIASVDTGEINTATNEGTGIGVFIGKTALNLRFKSIKAGPNIIVSENAGDIIIESTGGGGGGSGETNTASNLGTGGYRVFAQKNGVDFEFRRLTAGAGVTMTESANGIEIAAIAGTGEANTGTNIGGGVGEIFKQKAGTVLEFRRILAGSGISIINNANEVEISATGGGGGGEANTASNLGTGTGVFKTKTGADLVFRSIKAGSSIGVTLTGDDIVIDNLSAGEANTASNVGTGVSLFKQKAAADLEFRKLKGVGDITVQQNGDDVEISVAGAGNANEFSFTLPANATLAGRIPGVVGLPSGWALDTADNAAETEFGADADTLVITWAVGLGTKIAHEITIFQLTNAGPVATQGYVKLDLTAPGEQKTKVARTKAAAFLAGKGVSATKDLVVFVKLI